MNTRMKIKKGILKKSKRWYCIGCNEFTKQIPVYSKGWRNTEYISKYNCLSCDYTNYPSEYGCPKCGSESCEDTWIKSSQRRYDYAGSMNYGSCYDWTETHKCLDCGTIYEFDNSNC